MATGDGRALPARPYFDVWDAEGKAWLGWYPRMLIDWRGWRTVYLFTGGTAWRMVDDDDDGPTGPYPMGFRGFHTGRWGGETADSVPLVHNGREPTGP